MHQHKTNVLGVAALKGSETSDSVPSYGGLAMAT